MHDFLSRALWLGVVLLAVLAVLLFANEQAEEADNREAEYQADGLLQQAENLPAYTEFSKGPAPPDPPAGAVILPKNIPEESSVSKQSPVPKQGLVNDKKPVRLGLVIDDLGPNLIQSERALRLPGKALNFAFLPYADGEKLNQWTKRAHKKGHEVLLHLPMQPRDPEIDPGPEALYTSQTPAQIKAQISKLLPKLNHVAGVNNHMGSAFTRWDEGMAVVVEIIDENRLYFMDSLTSASSVALSVARSRGVPTIARDVFLDHNPDPAFIRKQLALFIHIANRRGRATAIAHPYPETLDILEKWIPEMEAKGYIFTTISALIALEAEKAKGKTKN